eukprot:1144311-Pelagomonas_calceolata.AAC.4
MMHSQIDVQVELEVQPPGFKVLLRPQHPPHHQPAGLAITYQGLRHVNSSGWIFGKVGDCQNLPARLRAQAGS